MADCITSGWPYFTHIQLKSSIGVPLLPCKVNWVGITCWLLVTPGGQCGREAMCTEPGKSGYSWWQILVAFSKVIQVPAHVSFSTLFWCQLPIVRLKRGAWSHCGTSSLPQAFATHCLENLWNRWVSTAHSCFSNKISGKLSVVQKLAFIFLLIPQI